MRWLMIAGGLAAAVVLFVLLRPGVEESAAPAEDTATAATTAPAPPPPASAPTETTAPPPPPPPPPPAQPKPEVTTIRIVIRGGIPQGGVTRATVRKGRRFRIVVRSDVADHVHLHGYDITRDVAPGKPAQIVTSATLTGVFEIELEDRGLPIAELSVTP